MYHYNEAITNTKGDALIGYYVKAVDPDTGSTVSIYADENGTPIVSESEIADTAKVDSDGMVSFYISTGEYHLDIYATDATTFVRRIRNKPMLDPTEVIDLVSNGIAKAATRAALGAIVDPSSGDTRFLAESGREGEFVWSNSNHATHVTNDPGQGVYVAPSSDTTGASGAWVRKFSGHLDVKWFGAAGDSNATGSTGTDDTTAIQRAINYASYINGAEIYFPQGHYMCASGLVLDDMANIKLAGPAGSSVGFSLPGPAELVYTGTGTGRFISARSSYAITIRDLGIRYSSASYTGNLIDFSHAASAFDSCYALIERCIIGGAWNGSSGVATSDKLINLELAILCSVVDCHVQWGVVGIAGRREVSVGNVGYSNAHTIQRCTFANLTTSAIINAGEGWTVMGCWFEGTNGGSGGMPRAYYDTISAPSLAITGGLSWIGNWHGDSANVTDAWFCNGNTFMRGLSIQGGAFSNEFSPAGTPAIKLTKRCEGLEISGAALSKIDLGGTGVDHNGVKITGNFMLADVANLSADSVNVSIISNAVNGVAAKTYLRQSSVYEWTLGSRNVPATGPGIFSLNAPTTTDAEITINGDSSQYRSVKFRSGATERVRLTLNPSSEFGVIGYDSGGNFVGYALTVNLSSLAVTFGGNIDLASGKDLSFNGTTVPLRNTTASKLIGRGSAGAGVAQEITLGSGLSMSGTTLSTAFRGALVKKSADQTGANYTTDTAIAWDAEDYDTDSIHDTVTNNTRLTVPSGVTKVRLLFNVWCNNVTGSSYVNGYLKKNNNVDFVGNCGGIADTSSTAPKVQGTTPVITVTAGDYFEVFLASETDTAIDILAARSWFAMEIVA